MKARTCYNPVKTSYDNPGLRKEFALDTAVDDSAASVMPMETPFEFELGTIVITAANDSPLGQPANMKEGERAMMLEMAVDLPTCSSALKAKPEASRQLRNRERRKMNIPSP